MKQRCIDEINAAAGRALTSAEVQGIEDRIAYHYRHAQAEAAENGWSRDDAFREAARRAGEEVHAEAAKKAQRVALQVLANDRVAATYAELHAVWGPTKALGRLIENADSYLKGVRATAFAKIVSAIEAAEPRFLGMMENGAATRDFVREVFGERSGNEVAARGAKAWLDGVEQLRVRANRAGFNIGKLDYGYFPHPHDDVAMLKAGKDAWVASILPKLRRDRYLNDDGSRMSDVQLVPVLERAFETITTNGTNKMDPTAYRGAGSRANRGSQHRELHFENGDAFLDYMNEFGRGTVWDAMKGHVDAQAGSIGLVEQFGPNPQRHFDQLYAQSLKDNAGVAGRYGMYSADPKHQWADLSGSASAVVNASTARVNQALRNVQVAGKLGATFLGAANDPITLATTALFNGMPVVRTIGEVFRSVGKDSRRFAAEAGLAVNSMVGDMATFSSENLLNNGWTSKLANATMKASLLEGWTQALQRGFSKSMMSTLAELSKTPWEKLGAADRARLEAAAVTPQDWALWGAAPRRKVDGVELIHHDDLVAPAGSSDAVARAHDQAASRLLGWIAKESDAALVIPDNYTRAALVRGLQKGTVEGEIARHVALFKGYLAAFGHRYLARIAELDMSVTGKVGLGVTLMAAMTMGGALTLQLKAIAAGKDPIDPTGPHGGKFWAAAFFQGGGSGIMGDLINQITSSGEPSRQAAGAASVFLGPTIGSGIDLATATLGEAAKKARGQKTDMGAKLLQFGRYNTPLGAPLNLWYTRAAVDHMFFHELQEQASPGYLSRMQQRAAKDYGQSYWWRPGGNAFTARGRDDAEPERAPNLSLAVGVR